MTHVSVILRNKCSYCTQKREEKEKEIEDNRLYMDVLSCSLCRVVSVDENFNISSAVDPPFSTQLTPLSLSFNRKITV